jgi:hypothetical protein
LQSVDAFNFLNCRRLNSDVLQTTSVGFALASSDIFRPTSFSVYSHLRFLDYCSRYTLIFLIIWLYLSIQNKLDVMLFILRTVSIYVYPCLYADFSVCMQSKNSPSFTSDFALLDLYGNKRKTR